VRSCLVLDSCESEVPGIGAQAHSAARPYSNRGMGDTDQMSPEISAQVINYQNIDKSGKRATRTLICTLQEVGSYFTPELMSVGQTDS